MKASYYLISHSNYAVQIHGADKFLFVSTNAHPKEFYTPEQLDKVVAIWKRHTANQK